MLLVADPDCGYWLLVNFDTIQGGTTMTRRTVFLLLSAALLSLLFSVADAQAQEAYGRQWGHSYSTQDWNRMYHYPYVYYPQKFLGKGLLPQ